MEKIKTLRGFRDIYGEELNRLERIEKISRYYLELMGFREISLPVLEKTELFVRSIGDATDIVEKEMFTFMDVSGDSLTLRPEATAGMVRAYLQEGLYAKENISKLFTIGPMFRHERPQKGRFRQFHQVDVEVFGTINPMIDAELLWIISLILGELGVRGYTIEINSVGCRVCRENFRERLVGYFGSVKNDLCEDCIRRLERNPLRIFDCKNASCIEAGRQSPLLYDSLCADCSDHFNRFMQYLHEYDIEFTVNKRLVRGLDYYTKTVFEVTSDSLGAQKAFLAGGRYDNLVREMGGPDIPSYGFAIGMERLALLVEDNEPKPESMFYFAYLGEKAKGFVIPVLRSFMREGIHIVYSYEDRSLKAQMRHADAANVRYVLILGDNEIEKNVIILRDMQTKNQYTIPFDPSGLPGIVSDTLSSSIHEEG